MKKLGTAYTLMFIFKGGPILTINGLFIFAISLSSSTVIGSARTNGLRTGFPRQWSRILVDDTNVQSCERVQFCLDLPRQSVLRVVRVDVESDSAVNWRTGIGVFRRIYIYM
jgi:hypothetical protein